MLLPLDCIFCAMYKAHVQLCVRIYTRLVVNDAWTSESGIPAAYCAYFTPKCRRAGLIKGRCYIKYLPHEKSAREEIITDLICLTHIKYRRPYKKVSHYRIAPRKVSPGRQFTGKNHPRPGGRRAGRIFAGKLSAGETFLGRRFYNGTPALPYRAEDRTIINSSYLQMALVHRSYS